MKTGVLTDPYGNFIGNNFSNTYPALDANHVYAYNCNEAIGATTLANVGGGANGTITLNGAANTDYVLNSKIIGRNVKSYRSILTNGGGYAATGTACNIAGGSVSLELFYYSIEESLSTNYIAWAADTANTNSLFLSNQFGSITASVILNGVGTFSTSYSLGYLYNVSAHHLITYSGTTGTLNYYINGLIVGTAAAGVHALPTLTQVGMNGYPGSNDSVTGAYSNFRVSNIARSAAYALATANTLLAM